MTAPVVGQKFLRAWRGSLPLEVATLAYQLEIFLDPDGLEFVTDCNKKVPSKQTVTESGKFTGPYSDPKSMIENAMRTSDDLAKNMPNVTGLPQGDSLLTGQHKQQLVDADRDITGMSSEDLLALVEVLKSRATSADGQVAALTVQLNTKDNTIADHVKTINELKTQLVVAKEGNVGFMVAADKSNVEKKLLTDTLAAEVVKNHKPFISNQLTAFKSSLDPLLALVDPLKDTFAKVSDVHQNVSKFGTDLTKSVEMLNAINDTNHESTLEYIGDVKSALAGVGISSAVVGSDIPKSLLSIDNTLRTNFGTQEIASKKHDGQCTFQAADGQPDILSCTQGCGAVLQMKPDVSTPSGPNLSVPPPSAAHSMGVQFRPPTPVSTPGSQLQQNWSSRKQFRFDNAGTPRMSKNQKRKLSFDNRVQSQFQSGQQQQGQQLQFQPGQQQLFQSGQQQQFQQGQQQQLQPGHQQQFQPGQQQQFQPGQQLQFQPGLQQQFHTGQQQLFQPGQLQQVQGYQYHSGQSTSGISDVLPVTSNLFQPSQASHSNQLQQFHSSQPVASQPPGAFVATPGEAVQAQHTSDTKNELWAFYRLCFMFSES